MGEQERPVLGSGGIRGAGAARPRWPWLDGFTISPGTIAPEARRQAAYPFAIRSEEATEAADEFPAILHGSVYEPDSSSRDDAFSIWDPDSEAHRRVTDVTQLTIDSTRATPDLRRSPSRDGSSAAPPVSRPAPRMEVETPPPIRRPDATEAGPGAMDARSQPAAPAPPSPANAFRPPSRLDTLVAPAARAPAPSASPLLTSAPARHREPERAAPADGAKPRQAEPPSPVTEITRSEEVIVAGRADMAREPRNTVPLSASTTASTHFDRLVLPGLRGAGSQPPRRTVHIGTLQVTVRAAELTAPTAAAVAPPQAAPTAERPSTTWLNPWASYHAIED